MQWNQKCGMTNVLDVVVDVHTYTLLFGILLGVWSCSNIDIVYYWSVEGMKGGEVVKRYGSGE